MNAVLERRNGTSSTLCEAVDNIEYAAENFIRELQELHAINSNYELVKKLKELCDELHNFVYVR